MKKILTFGVFDYFHLGHLRLFKQCKEYADYLIVAVQNGEYILKFKPDANVLYSTEERVEILEALRIVDKVLVYDSVDIETLKKLILMCWLLEKIIEENDLIKLNNGVLLMEKKSLD